MKKLFVLTALLSLFAVQAHASTNNLKCEAEVSAALDSSGVDLNGTIILSRDGKFYVAPYVFDNGDNVTYGHVVISVDSATCAVSDESTWKFEN